MSAQVTTPIDLDELVREFLARTDLPIAVLCRRTGLSTTTIRNVMRGGPYSPDTETRIRQGIQAFADDVADLVGRGN